MEVHDKVLWFLGSRPDRYKASDLANLIGCDQHETKVACVELTRDKKIIGHEQNGVIVYYAKGAE